MSDVLKTTWKSQFDVLKFKRRRLRHSRKRVFAGPRHSHVLLTSASCFLKPSNISKGNFTIISLSSSIHFNRLLTFGLAILNPLRRLPTVWFSYNRIYRDQTLPARITRGVFVGSHKIVQSFFKILKNYKTDIFAFLQTKKHYYQWRCYY